MIIYTDGHLNGKNNLFYGADSGYTLLVFDNKKIKIDYQKKQLTNSEAEIIAVIHACFYAKEGDIIVSDSQYVVNSINLNWKSKETRLENLLAVAKSVLKLSGAKLEWRKREENKAT